MSQPTQAEQKGATERRSNRSAILRMAVPATVSQLSMVLVQAIDMVFIGRLDALAIGAVGFIGTLLWNVESLSEGMAVGMGACMSRRIGAKDRQDALNFYKTGLIAVSVLGFLVVPPLLLLRNLLFGSLNMPPELFGFAADYYRYFCLFFPVLFFRVGLEAGFRAAGDTRSPMLAGFITNLLNIGLNYMLIFGLGPIPALGVSGAAIASGLSMIGGGIYLLAVAERKGLNPFTPQARFLWAYLVRIVRVAIPAAAERLAMSVSQTLVLALAVNPLGGLQSAAFHIVMRLASFSFMPGFGFSIAATSLVGQQLGAGQPAKAARLAWLTTLYCSIVMVGVSTVYFLFPGFLAGLFSRDAAVIAATALPLRIYALSGFFLGPTMVLNGALHGAGDTRFTMTIMLLSRFVLRLPGAWFLSIGLGWGLAGAWLGMSLDFIVRGILLMIRTKGGRWQKIAV